MPQEQFQSVKQNQSPNPERSQEDRDSTVTACISNKVIRDQTHEAGRSSESKVLLVRLLSGLSTDAARDQVGNGDVVGSRTPQK